MKGLFRRAVPAFAFLLVEVVYPHSPHAFDCAKAFLPVDFVICSDPAALKANEAHEKAWYGTRERLSDSERQELLNDQRRWLKEFPPRCGVPAKGKPLPVISKEEQVCVAKALEERMAFLQQYHRRASEAQSLTATPPRDTSVPPPQPVPTPTPAPRRQQTPLPISAPVIVKGIKCGMGFVPANKLINMPVIEGFKAASDLNGYIAVVSDVQSGSIYHLPLSAAQIIPHEDCVEAIVELLAPGQLDALDHCLKASTPDEQGCLRNILEELGLGVATQDEIAAIKTSSPPAPTPTPASDRGPQSPKAEPSTAQGQNIAPIPALPSHPDLAVNQDIDATCAAQVGWAYPKFDECKRRLLGTTTPPIAQTVPTAPSQSAAPEKSLPTIRPLDCAKVASIANSALNRMFNTNYSGPWAPAIMQLAQGDSHGVFRRLANNQTPQSIGQLVAAFIMAPGGGFSDLYGLDGTTLRALLLGIALEPQSINTIIAQALSDQYGSEAGHKALNAFRMSVLNEVAGGNQPIRVAMQMNLGATGRICQP